MLALLFVPVAAAVAATGGGQVSLRHGDACLDYAGASNQHLVKTASCSDGSTTQLFTYTAAQQLVLAGAEASCVGGSPCCVENWPTGPTIFSCSNMPNIKVWAFNNQTGHLQNSGACLTAGVPATVGPCSATDPHQMWRVNDISPAPPAPPAPLVSATCAKRGCPSQWDPNQPCQCNPDCERYGNCCADKEKVCGKDPPFPGPAPAPSPSGCPNMAGPWTTPGTQPTGGATMTITQTACNISISGHMGGGGRGGEITATANITHEWSVEALFRGDGGPAADWRLSGHLTGCSPAGCGKGTSITWSGSGKFSGSVWTKQDGNYPPPPPSPGGCCQNNCWCSCGGWCGGPSPPPWQPGHCTDMVGDWDTNEDDDSGTAAAVVTITQSSCKLTATDDGQPWSPAKGSFADQWDVQLDFSGSERRGHLNGCDPQTCSQGSSITWTSGAPAGTRWTKHGGPAPPPPPSSGCPLIEGKWRRDKTPFEVVRVTQSECTLTATDALQSWSPAHGTFDPEAPYEVTMTFGKRNGPTVGHLVGCTATGCGAGSLVRWGARNVTWSYFEKL